MSHPRAYADLRAYLQATGTTNLALAKRLDIHPSYVAHLRAGRKIPSFRLAAKIAREINIPIESLLEVAS